MVQLEAFMPLRILIVKYFMIKTNYKSKKKDRGIAKSYHLSKLHEKVMRDEI